MTSKRIYLADHLWVNEESALELLSTGSWADRIAFIQSLPSVVCYEWVGGLNGAFAEWLLENGIEESLKPTGRKEEGV